MEKDNLKEYIESKEYFKDARHWYNWKYIMPMSHRVWLFYGVFASVLILFSLSIDINHLLPVKQRLVYGINVISDATGGETEAQVIEMKGFKGISGPKRFIASNLVKNYVISREEFDYKKIKQQFEYVRATSTRLVFKRYYSYMGVNNPDSPLMRYQQYAIRKININDIQFISDKNALVKFRSTAKDANKQFENLMWEASVNFDMGEVGKRAPNGSDFKFIVTDYKLRLLGEVK